MTRTLPMVAFATALLSCASAEAQTKYFARQAIPTVAASSGTPAPTPKTLTCNGPILPYTLPYPTQAGGNLLASGSPTVETARKVCNDAGAANGVALKAYTHCQIVVNQAGPDPTGYNVYMWQATGTYEYDRSNPYWAGHMTASCTYNP